MIDDDAADVEMLLERCGADGDDFRLWLCTGPPVDGVDGIVITLSI
jgi:hypothetical protein